MKIGVKPLKGVWLVVPIDVINSIATAFCSNIPQGYYDVKIEGTSKNVSVKLKILAIGYVFADGRGSFEYSYRTAYQLERLQFP